MTVSEELIAHIRDTNVPDKKRILRTRFLANELAGDIQDRALAKSLVQQLNNAYLVLQLATLSEDPAMAVSCRKDCVTLVSAIDRARPAARPSRATAADEIAALPA